VTVLPDAIGREHEIELLRAALDSGAHVVLEGPPGTGKSTVLRAVAASQDIPFLFVEGNAELTPARLVGHFDPARVLADGYVEEIFVDGPLVAALRSGGLLYVEELNRVPEETLNVLITVMSEGELHVPRLGSVDAAPGFRLVAAMNPFDAVGTARISGWATSPPPTKTRSSCATHPPCRTCGAREPSSSRGARAGTPTCASAPPCAGRSTSRGSPRRSPSGARST
jgi:hypothetical protein